MLFNFFGLEGKKPKSKPDPISANDAVAIQKMKMIERDVIKSELKLLKKIKGNEICCDCLQKNPQWCSVTLGSFVCVSCAGAHRCLGTHISRIKNIYLDIWKMDELRLMKKRGNEWVNAKYLAKIKANMKCPKYVPEYLGSEGQLQKLKMKYEKKVWCLEMEKMEISDEEEDEKKITKETFELLNFENFT